MILIFLAILMLIAAGQLIAYFRAPSRYDVREEDDRR